MIVKSKNMSWAASDSPDVGGYVLYIEPAGNPVSYESLSYDVGNVTTINLADYEMPGTQEGVFNIGVTAYDEAGNESAMSIANNVDLDFEAPNPPGALTFS